MAARPSAGLAFPRPACAARRGREGEPSVMRDNAAGDQADAAGSGGASRPVATADSRPRSAVSPRSQVTAAAATAPTADRPADTAGSASISAMAAAQTATSSGETRTAAGPVTSDSTGISLATTGTPDAMASSTGSPYPSASEGKANTDAARCTAGSSSSATSGTSSTRDASPSSAISPGSGSGKLESK